MRRNDVHLRRSSHKTHTGPLKPIDAAEARAEVAVAQVRVRLRSLLGRVHRRERHVPGHVVVEQEWWRKVEAPSQKRTPTVDKNAGSGSGEALFQNARPEIEPHGGKVGMVRGCMVL